MNRNGRPTAGVLLALAFLLTALLPGSGTLAEGGANLVTLQADQAPIGSILQQLAAKGGMNIVTGPEVGERKISISIVDTPFEEALNLVVRAAGLGYERVGGTILVADAQVLQTKTGLETRVFDLEYADAEEVQKALQVITGEVSAVPGGQRIIVRGTPSELEQATAVLRQLDSKPQQVVLEARLVEVNTSKLQEMGIDWEKITKWSTLVTEGNHGTSELGQLPSDIGFYRLNDGNGWYRQAASFNVAIEELITTGHARLLSNTKVVTVDGQPAEIFAGETVPVVITSLQNPGEAGGVLQTVQLEKIDVGVRLNITPRISEDGLITALVEPEVSRIIRFVGPDDDLPQTSTRRASTIVRVHDGETIFLGGLLTEEERKDVKKVPLLGDIPLLGALFRHTRTEKVRLDLVIEITPHLVGDSGGLAPTAASESVTLQQDVREAADVVAGRRPFDGKRPPEPAR